MLYSCTLLPQRVLYRANEALFAHMQANMPVACEACTSETNYPS